MNANVELERRLADYYATEAPPRAPDRVLEAVLATSDITTQRRALVRAPWRFPIMNSYAKMAIAAVVVIAIGAVGLAVLRPGSSPAAGGPASPRPSTEPSSSPIVSLTQPFTSTVHGFSMSYPAGWHSRVAREAWTGAEPPNFQSSSADVMYDPALTDHLFLIVTSQSLGGANGEVWAEEISSLSGWDDACTPTFEPITIDGADGAVLAACEGPLTRATAWAGDRGYLIWAYGLDDKYGSDDVVAFSEILDTIQINPDDSVAASLPIPLSETFASSTHGISVSYPADWTTVPATDPASTAEPGFLNPAGDFLYDPGLDDGHLFIALGSEALDGQAGEDWATAVMNDQELGCGDAVREPITVDGSPGRICDTLALVWVADRGFEIRLHVSPDDPAVGEVYDRTWFENVLATVQLNPEDAVAP